MRRMGVVMGAVVSVGVIPEVVVGVVVEVRPGGPVPPVGPVRIGRSPLVVPVGVAVVVVVVAPLLVIVVVVVGVWGLHKYTKRR